MLLLVVPGIMTGMLVPKVASPVLKAASLAKGPGMTGLQDMSIIGRALLSSFADIAEDGMMTGMVVPKVASLVLKVASQARAAGMNGRMMMKMTGCQDGDTTTRNTKGTVVSFLCVSCICVVMMSNLTHIIY